MLGGWQQTRKEQRWFVHAPADITALCGQGGLGTGPHVELRDTYVQSCMLPAGFESPGFQIPEVLFLFFPYEQSSVARL